MSYGDICLRGFSGQFFVTVISRSVIPQIFNYVLTQNWPRVGWSLEKAAQPVVYGHDSVASSYACTVSIYTCTYLLSSFTHLSLKDGHELHVALTMYLPFNVQTILIHVHMTS